MLKPPLMGVVKLNLEKKKKKVSLGSLGTANIGGLVRGPWNGPRRSRL